MGDAKSEPSEDEFNQVGVALKDFADKMSPAQRRSAWDFWHGSRLRKEAHGLIKGWSYFEALWNAGGRLVWNEGAYEIEKDDFAELFNHARTSVEAFDLLKVVCASRVSAGLELSAEQKVVAAALIRGDLKRPPKKGRSRAENWARNVLIIRGVQAAMRLGFQLERSEGSGSDCAFSIVAETFNEAGYHMVTYDTVAGVWRRNKAQLGKEIEKLNFSAAAAQRQEGDQ
ncbi:hypothetical protein [Actibacterium pelagium]|uniref:Uncharacterized protein n=1 Tax=Actibacterium pelagium TaxID=2029103 RepID=A0A917AK30_9RHOB|nr:hypothetical protein [Actibacterium pelagium]GGE57485.1 hypothetical protein GCM10011517_26590 [Actibacterium pelagium]